MATRVYINIYIYMFLIYICILYKCYVVYKTDAVLHPSLS